MSDYADIANLSWDNIQEPKLLPRGSYLLRLRNVSYQEPKDSGQNGVVMFVHVPKEPMNDVSDAELAELGEDYDISENKVFTRVYIEDGTSWRRVRDILANHGFEVSGGVIESLKAASKAKLEVIGFLDRQAFTRKDGSAGEANNITEFAKV